MVLQNLVASPAVPMEVIAAKGFPAIRDLTGLLTCFAYPVPLALIRNSSQLARDCGDFHEESGGWQGEEHPKPITVGSNDEPH
jgi:hypothetical protein